MHVYLGQGRPVRNGEMYTLLFVTMGFLITSETLYFAFLKEREYFSYTEEKDPSPYIFGYGEGKAGEDLFHYQREENRWCLNLEYAGDKNIVYKQTCHREFSVNLFPHHYIITIKYHINLILLKWEPFFPFLIRICAITEYCTSGEIFGNHAKRDQ